MKKCTTYFLYDLPLGNYGPFKEKKKTWHTNRGQEMTQWQCQERHITSPELQGVYADEASHWGSPTGRSAWTQQSRNNCRGGSGRMKTDGHVPGQRGAGGGRLGDWVMWKSEVCSPSYILVTTSAAFKQNGKWRKAEMGSIIHKGEHSCLLSS